MPSIYSYRHSCFEENKSFTGTTGNQLAYAPVFQIWVLHPGLTSCSWSKQSISFKSKEKRVNLWCQILKHKRTRLRLPGERKDQEKKSRHQQTSEDLCSLLADLDRDFIIRANWDCEDRVHREASMRKMHIFAWLSSSSTVYIWIKPWSH